MQFHSAFVLAAYLVSQVHGVACPFQALRESGQLGSNEAAAFDAVKRDPAAAEALLKEHARRDAEPEANPVAEPHPEPEPQIIGGGTGGGGGGGPLDPLGLPLGGGLLNGVLQKLTGPLQDIDIPTPQPQGLKQIPGNDPNHQFKKPGPTDVRGICPTLNALANHGYISRNGITSFAEAANAVQTGYGFTYPLSVFLSALGLLAGGDLVTGKYSIGGADSRVPNTIGPALGLDKHGVFEIDGSITRQDVHFGNNANFLKQRWDEYVATANKHGGLFNEQTNAEDNGIRYDYSRETNPEFLAGVAWFAVSHAERVFVYQGLANGTTQRADYKSVSPFFLDERFPENWYRRSTPFTLASAFADAGDMFLNNPRELGGNEGLNNFLPLHNDLSTKTPQQAGCFIIENIFDIAPNQFQPAIANNYKLFEGFVTGVMAPFFVNDGYFNCNLTNFVKPSASAGSVGGSKSSSGSPVNGSYPGIGIIKPDSQPS